MVLQTLPSAHLLRLYIPPLQKVTAHNGASVLIRSRERDWSVPVSLGNQVLSKVSIDEQAQGPRCKHPAHANACGGQPLPADSPKTLSSG